MEIQLELEIEGKCPSKKNQYKQGRGHWYKPKEVNDFIESALWQIKGQMATKEKIKKLLPIKGNVGVYFMFEMIGRDRDIDGMTTTILDVLQSAGIFNNDAQVVDVGAIKYKGKEDLTKIFIKSL